MQKKIISFSGEFDFLSNFHPVEIFYDGRWYHTSEAAFQAAKTVDERWKQRIANAKTPGEAKRLGRQAPMRIDWDEIKDKVMLDILRLKFTKGSDLAERLDKTGEAVLVEGTTWHDQYWGVCTCPKCKGYGRNILGQLLMIVRIENRIPSLTHAETDEWLFGKNDGC